MKPPATQAAREVRAKLQALAARGVGGEAESGYVLPSSAVDNALNRSISSSELRSYSFCGNSTRVHPANISNQFIREFCGFVSFSADHQMAVYVRPVSVSSRCNSLHSIHHFCAAHQALRVKSRSVLVTFRLASLCVPVGHVCRIVSEEEVGRVAAWRVVALVKDENSIRYFSDREGVGNTVALECLVRRPEMAVPAFDFTILPGPARPKLRANNWPVFINLAPKSNPVLLAEADYTATAHFFYGVAGMLSIIRLSVPLGDIVTTLTDRIEALAA